MRKKNKNSGKKPKKKRIYNKYSYDLRRRVVNDILKGIISKEEAMLKYGINDMRALFDNDLRLLKQFVGY